MSDEVRLTDIATIIMGTSPPSDTYNEVGLGMPLLNGPTEFGSSHPDCTLFTTDSRRECNTGDLLFCVRGSTTGRMNWADRPYSLGRGICAIRGISSTETKFIKYCLDYGLEALLVVAGGGTFPNLTKGDIHNFRIPYPPHRNSITAVLSAYDDLIENNRQRIEALEAAALALYREWFVEMRFPGWQDVEWVESEWRMIPAGWEVVPLSDAIEINPRHSLPNDTEKYYVPMAGLSENSMLITEYSVRTGRSGAKFKNGDTLFARITPSLENGKTGYVQFLPSDETVAIGSTEFIVMRSKSLCPEFVYLLARSHEVREPAIGSMTGASGRQRVQHQVFDEIYIPQPDHQILRLFQEQVSTSFELIRTLSERNAVLRETRDLLLPRLISGEVSVEELPLPGEVE